MGITMSGATVDQSSRDQLRNVEAINLGKGEGRGLFSSGSNLVGITPDFAANVSTAIETYIQGVKDCLNKLDAKDPSTAFKGTAINSAIVQFVAAVKEVSLKYTGILEESRKEIVANVDKAYAQQDSDISGNLSSDIGKLGN